MSAPEHHIDAESVAKIRELLNEEGFTESSMFTDKYINRVLSVPDRSFEKSHEKLKSALQWRREFKVDELDPANFNEQLVSNSMYWYGRDVHGYPILWLISSRKDYRNIDVDKEIQSVVWLAELALKHMPEGKDTFTLINVTSNIGMSDFSIPYFRGLLNVLTNGYPDRMHRFYAGPTNFVVQMVYKMLVPFLPSNLTRKIFLLKDDSEMVPIFKEGDLPDYYGGSVVHPLFAKPSDPNTTPATPEPLSAHQQATQKAHNRKSSDTSWFAKRVFSHSRSASVEVKSIPRTFDWQAMVATMKKFNEIKY
eukprot:TRINITY_DN1780_c0_g1_i1.p1 TRINITY_DN1780_c0_g1~~TRINITY_DN1780_c0_g1_i1.p1  ORF type:complete len:308 (-),score=93.09 TRINITY_DN1780_c0_g1_i1:2-925(-)